MNRIAATPLMLAGLLGMASACAGSDGSEPTNSATATVEVATTESSAEAAQTTAPADTAGTVTDDTAAPAAADRLDASGQLAWVLDVLASPEAPALEEFEAHFAPSFLQLVSPDELVGGLAPILGQWTVGEDAGDAIARSGLIESADGLRLQFDIAVDPANGLITDLLFRPASPLPDGPVTVESVDDAVGSIAAQAGYALFDTSSGSCEPIHELNADEPMAIGSEFKLWILIALAEQIEAGTISWSETVTLNEEVRANPDGDVAQRPNGTAIPVSDLAGLMISISDNTATDMLLDLVGREAVEDVMVRLGVSTAERNIPLVGAREMFLLKFDAANAGYADLTSDERRSYLDDTLAGQSFSQISESDIPPPPWDIDRLEWYATPDDICKTFVRLAEISTRAGMSPVAEALGTNPGTEIDRSKWDTVWYKGGSEPGVFAMSWYLVDVDGNSVVATGALNDSTTVFSELDAASKLPLMIALAEVLRP